MATLEIHDGRGQVQYLSITREQPVVFGSDPRCDIVLHDPAALPFHGRIGWRKTRYKVEAFPEARAVEIDGKKVVASSFRQGGEIRIGDARIFLVTPDDGVASVEKPRSPSAPERGPIAAAAFAPPSVEQTDFAPPSLERADFAPPSVEQDFSAVEDALKRARPKPKTPPNPVPTPAAERSPSGVIRRVRERLGLQEVAPGQETISRSPLVLGLAAALVGLSVTGFALYEIIGRMTTNRRFESAMESLENGEFRTAQQRFTEFVTSYPKEARAPRARALGMLAAVRQFTSGGSPAWGNALDATRAMHESLTGDPIYDDVRADLATEALNTATGLAERARDLSDPQALQQADSAVKLHDDIGGDAAAGVRQRYRFPVKLEAARAAVAKALFRNDCLARMDAALAQRDPSATYAARDRLVTRYSDLSADAKVLEKLRAANDLIREAATSDDTRRAAATDERPEPLGPPLSLVFRSTASAPPAAGSPPVFAVAEGLAYALEGGAGAPIWQRPVGQDAPFPPRPIAGTEGAVLVVDARSNELLRLDGQTGKLVWRQALGEPVVDPPLVTGNQVVQATPTGKLLQIDLNSGELLRTMSLGRPLATSPVADEVGKHLYALGQEDIVFVLQRDPLSCVGVEYLGHASGSVPSSPARLGNYFVVSENHRAGASRWSIFILEDDGLELRLAQRVEFPGWSWDPPASLGSVIWSITDLGGVQAFAIGPYEEASPFKPIARIAPEAVVIGPTYPKPRTERELWVASGRSAAYDLDIEAATIRPRWTLAQAGAAGAPLQQSGTSLVLTQEPNDLQGVMLWAIDPANGAPRWRTLLGAAWTSQPQPSDAGQSAATLDAEGRRLVLSREELTAGGFVIQPLPAPGQDRLPPGRIDWAEVGDWSIIQPQADSVQIRVRQGDSDELRLVDLPTPPAAPLQRWGNDLLLAGAEGRVFRIDPSTGAPTAEPYMPAFDRGDPIHWLEPVVCSETVAILAERDGTIRRLSLKSEPRPTLSIDAEVKLDSTLAAAPAGGANAVLLLTADRRLRALATRDLSPAGLWDLAAPAVFGPIESGGLIFVADADGGLLAFDIDARRLWGISLPDHTLPSGPPAVVGDHVWVAMRSGHLLRLDRATGNLIDDRDLDTLPVDGPLVLDGLVLLPSAPGTLRSLTSE